MKPKCVTVGAVAIAATCAMAVFPAMAQVGGKSARLVVGFTPGGSSDMTARLAAPEMSKILGYSIVVENKPGASTNIAHEYVAKATADGMTMLLGFVVSFGFILPINAPQNMVCLGTETFTSKQFTRIGLWLTGIGYALLLVFALTWWKFLGYV